MKIREQPIISPGLDPYVFISWDKQNREPDITLGGGFNQEVHLPDLAERLHHLADELAELNRNRTNG